MKESLSFLKVALFNGEVGALARSSRFVVTAVRRVLPKRKLDKIIEYGSGDGVMTLELLKHLSPEGRFLAVEIDPKFLKVLGNINDPRITVVDDTIQNVSRNIEKYGFDRADLVVSSIPFSYLSKLEREEVCRLTRGCLADGGMFIVFHQYSTIMARPIRKFFGKVKVNFEPRNFLPCFIMSVVL